MSGIGSLANVSGLLLLAAQFQLARSDPNATGTETQTTETTPTASTITGAASSPATYSFVGHISPNSVTTTFVATGTSTGDPVENWYQNAANAYLEYNSMSSQEISNTLYAGGGLNPLYANNTFAGQISAMEKVASYDSSESSLITQWVAQGMPADNSENINPGGFVGMTAAQVTSEAAELSSEAASTVTQAGQLQTAFDNHTLTFQNAADVQGLDYTETDSMSATDSGGTSSMTQSYNQAFLNQDTDGTQNTLLNIGGVELYLSW